tara:strand:+ start:3114 stop:4823 length:1710 start_codon:yes stop_codon:yes gene_type:complete
MNEKNFKSKYFKYKSKYLKLQQFGGEQVGCSNKPNVNVSKIRKLPDKKITLNHTIIQDKAYYFTDVEEIIITHNVQEIGKSSFGHCINLKRIDMTKANNLKKIKDGAFYNCRSLTSILIPRSVSIEPKAFKHCSNLKIVFVENIGRFNGIRGTNFEGNQHIKILPDKTSQDFYFNCCNENLRIYNGNYYLQKNTQFSVKKMVNITREKNPDGFDLCKDDSYIQLLNRDGLLKNNFGGYREFDSEILYIGFGGLTNNFWEQTRRYTSYKCNLLYFYDTNKNWYMDKKMEIFQIINNILIIKPTIKKVIFQGTSMGGYIALYLSSFMDTLRFNDKQIICIAISPQTFNKQDGILFHKNVETRKYPDGLKIPNIKDIISTKDNDVKRYILIGYHECKINDKGKWMDTLMATNLLGVKNTKILVTPHGVHNIWASINSKLFYKLISENFTTLYTDINNGAIILNNSLEYTDVKSLLKYNRDTGVIIESELSQIGGLPAETAQIKSAMVWGALNRANSIDGINSDLRLKYILQNEKMMYGNPESNTDTCQFIRDYVELSQNAEWVHATIQTLGL